MRSSKPKPFQRKSVSVSAIGEKRVWRMTIASNLRPGDTVPDLGLLHEVIQTVDSGGNRIVVVKAGVDNTQKTFRASESVQAFVIS